MFVSLVFVSLVDWLFVATMRFQGTPQGGQLSSFPLDNMKKYEKKNLRITALDIMIYQQLYTT